MEACCSRFTAAEGGARLAAAANVKNTLAVEYASFIATRLVHEEAYKIRGSLCEGRQRSVYVTRASRVNVVAYELNILTDLSIIKGLLYSDVQDWSAELETKEVLVCTSVVLKQILEEEILAMARINVLILDSCHLVCKDNSLQQIMKHYKECDEDKKPRILALTYPLFASNKRDVNSEPLTKSNSDDNVNSETLATVGEIDETPKEAEDTAEETKDSTEEMSETAKETNEAKETTVETEQTVEETKDPTVEENKTTENLDDIPKKEETSMEIAVIGTEIDNESISAKRQVKTEVNDNTQALECEEIGSYENLDDFDMYEKLEWKIEELEKDMCCQMDLAEDIDGGKRLSATIAKPKELIIEYGSLPSTEKLSEAYIDVEKYMKDTVNEALEFIDEHRYDPTEIYGEDLYEEFMNIPNPTIEPKFIFKQFLYVLEQLGPYAADKAAFSLLTKLEKLKIKVPYERHFLLLCLCTSVFVKIRCYADLVFSKYESDWEKIQLFCTPKVLRFTEILEKFQPPELAENNRPNNSSGSTSKVNKESGYLSSSVNTNKDSEHKNTAKDSGDTCKSSEITSKIAEDTSDSSGNTTKDSGDTGKSSEITSKIAEDISDSSGNTTKDSGDTCKSSEVTSKIAEDTNDSSGNTSKDSGNANIRSGSPEDGDKKTSKTNEMIKEIETCDFISLSNKIEDRIHTYEANLKEIDVANTENGSTNINSGNENTYEGNLKEIELPDTESKSTNINSGNENVNSEKVPNGNQKGTDSKDGTYQGRGILGFPRRTGHRTRGRGRLQRSNAARVQQMQQNPDALCGIVFMKEALMAKIMFMLIVDMSRCHPKLAYLCAQYCAVERAADPGTEPRECQRQGKKQEDVLKKFRMHECNILLATSALEEGIDLPRCNLVLRWDLPPSYRSYGLCRSRARAPRAACALLARAAGDHTAALLHNVAVYRELDQIISRKCGCGVQDEPPQTEEDHADSFTHVIRPYTPNDTGRKPNDNGKISSDNGKISNDNGKVPNVKENIRIANNDKEINGADDEISENEDIPNNDMKALRCNENSVKRRNIKPNSEKAGMSSNFSGSNGKLNNDSNDNDDNSVISGIVHINENNDSKINDNRNNDRINNDCNDSKDACDNNDNVFCNKCNVKKVCVNTECPCVLNSFGVGKTVASSSDSNKNVKKCDSDAIASVDLSTAIALINRYCGKLPSDTFTRLAPQWWLERVALPARGGGLRPAYVCTLRLPLNCPVKYNIVGHPMPTRVLARRMVALQACRILHKSGELDNQLMPIGKENFKAAELEATAANIGGHSGDASDPNDSARPGTTKRRQYYFKRTAWAFTDCQPVVDATDAEIETPDGSEPLSPQPEDVKQTKTGTKRNMLYAIVSKLWCALPERYNTRGRRLHAPQHASQAIGILMARDEPDNLQIPSFPVYTRSGEVRVSVEHVPGADVRVSPRRARRVRRFMRFVFAEVLRVRRRGMRLQSDGSTHNNYYIVPTIKTMREDGTTQIDIDWSFLELIYQHTEAKKHSELEKPILWHHDEEEEEEESAAGDKVENVDNEKDGKVKKMVNPLLGAAETFIFDAEKYREAVVTPWYRNQDQPQFFLVAEICWNLTPDSAFPSTTHTSFRHYYSSKYGVVLTQPSQPLLDVDHTSARLNLLTPRYVNRKGVALPVSSERTRRAKRDRLDQKQILVPELCRVHPFAAPLWFATVALPCVLYRINALLIADEIRRAVAIDVGLGIPKLEERTWAGFQWPPLDFGWSLAEVLSADSEKNEKKKEEEDAGKKADEMEEIDENENRTETEDDNTPEEPRVKTLNDLLQEEVIENGFEIGTWSNEMASSLPAAEPYDEYLEPLPANLTFCTSASGGTNWCDPIQKPKSQFNPSRAYAMADSDCSYMSSDFDTDDSDLNSEGTDDDTDTSGFCSSKFANAAMGVRIEYKTAHEAEAVDVERKKKTNPAPQPDEEDDALDRLQHDQFIKEGVAPEQYIEKFRRSVDEHKKEIVDKGFLIKQDTPIVEILPEPTKESQEKLAKADRGLEKLAKTDQKLEKVAKTDQELEDIADKLSKLDLKVDSTTKDMIDEIFPYGSESTAIFENGQINLETIEKNKRVLLAELKKSLSKDEIKKLNCFSMIDVDIDSARYVNEKVVNVGFDTKDSYEDRINKWIEAKDFKPYYQESKDQGKEFDFDYQPSLEGHPGPSPSVILQALTMSNANDGINLERLETIGDSFLKFAITAYLYCAHPTVHEGKLSHMRSKQVSNLNLYRLGRGRRLGARMIASKFEPHDNWLPPCHKPPSTLHPRTPAESQEHPSPNPDTPLDSSGCFIPYNLITQHSIPDKSIADCVEALIGAYLLECGPRGALLFMSWLGIRVLPRHDLPLPAHHPYVAAHRGNQADPQKPPPQPSPKRGHRDATDSDTDPSSDEEEEPCRHQQELFPETDWSWPGRPVGSLRPYRDASGRWRQPIFGELKAPPSPLLRYIEDPEGELEQMLSGYDALERTLQYRFKDRSLLLQALTHASHQQNRLTDCYQRLEFLGDAILDYLITRHLYEDPRRHSPGALTDLRSALVNNTIFATLAARHGFHKYFRHMSPGLNEVLTKYVRIQEENGHSISEEHYLIQEDEMEQAEDVEVPKALGDLFESVAGAIFLDSGMSLGAVWKSYVTLMGAELEAFSAAAPKSPVRELLEAEPDTAKFGKPERLADGRRVRVCVEVFGRGAFKGVGRNYRIAKGTAARCALRHLRNHRAR